MMQNTMVLALVLISTLAFGFVSTGPINGQLDGDELPGTGMSPGLPGGNERLANLAGLLYGKGPMKPTPQSGKGNKRPTLPGKMTEKQKAVFEECYDYRTHNFIDICIYNLIFGNGEYGRK